MSDLYPAEIHALASYRLEVTRGLTHTPEYDAAMAELQRRWDAAYPQAGGCVPAGPVERADTRWI
jgi:hypothetical protein